MKTDFWKAGYYTDVRAKLNNVDSPLESLLEVEQELDEKLKLLRASVPGPKLDFTSLRDYNTHQGIKMNPKKVTKQEGEPGSTWLGFVTDKSWPTKFSLMALLCSPLWYFRDTILQFCNTHAPFSGNDGIVANIHHAITDTDKMKSAVKYIAAAGVGLFFGYRIWKWWTGEEAFSGKSEGSYVYRSLKGIKKAATSWSIWLLILFLCAAGFMVWYLLREESGRVTIQYDIEEGFGREGNPNQPGHRRPAGFGGFWPNARK